MHSCPDTDIDPKKEMHGFENYSCKLHKEHGRICSEKEHKTKHLLEFVTKKTVPRRTHFVELRSQRYFRSLVSCVSELMITVVHIFKSNFRKVIGFVTLFSHKQRVKNFQRWTNVLISLSFLFRLNLL